MMPLMDVLFLLIIFFMLTTTFKKSDGELIVKEVELPLATVSTRITEKEILTVTITGRGEYFVADEPCPEDLLEERIKSGFVNKKALLIRGDRKAEFQKVVHLYDIMQILGIESFSHQVGHLP